MKLTIVGLGTVGTSLGMALKAVNADIEIVGHDPNSERLQRGRKLGAIDKSHWNLVAACEEADLVFLDLPLEEIEKTLAAVGDTLKDGAVVVDTAPVKRPVLDLARRYLGEGAHFVGGHVVSAKLADHPEPSPGLLEGALFYLVSEQDDYPQALDVATNLAQAVGARPRYIDAAEHDGVVAGTSHLPMATALALLGTLGGELGLEERARSAGGEIATLDSFLEGLEDASVSLLLANADNLVHWLDALTTELTALRREITDADVDALTERLKAARERCHQWLAGEGADEAPALEVESPWRRMFFGGLGRPRRRGDSESHC